MSQDDIDAFVRFVGYGGTISPEAVTAAVVSKQVPVNGRSSDDGWTALHFAVYRSHPVGVTAALLAAGADANVKDIDGATPVWVGGYSSTVAILQLLIDAGGSVNEANHDGQTPLIALVRNNVGDAAARLGVLLARPNLDLDARFEGKTAEEWAMERGHGALGAAIAAEVCPKSCSWACDVQCALSSTTRATNHCLYLLF